MTNITVQNVANCRISCVSSDTATIHMLHVEFLNIPTNFISATSSELHFTDVLAVNTTELNDMDLTNGGFLECGDCTNVTIWNCTFRNIHSRQNGGVIYSDYSNPLKVMANNVGPALMSIYESLFSNTSSGQAGGALYLAEGNLFSGDMILDHTTAGSSGGGAEIVCNSLLTNHTCDYTFNYTIFNYSTAGFGGAIHYDNIEPILKNVTYNHLSIKYYGLELAGVPAFFKPIAMMDQPKGITIDNLIRPNPNETFDLSSGAKIERTMKYVIFDSQGQLVTAPLDNTCRVSIDQNGVTVQGNTIAKITEGECYFDEISIISKPGTLFNMSVSTSAINYANPEPNLSVQPDPVRYDVLMVTCPVGSILINNVCNKCPAGYYSFDNTETFCHPCRGGMICSGGSDVTMEPGFWRKDNTSDDVYACSLAENCLGQSDIGICKEGHQGRLCGVCLDTWFKNGEFSCTQCQSKTQALIFGIANLCGLCLFLVVIVWLSVKSADKEAKTTSVLLRILLNFVQEIVILRNLDLKWPIQISSFFTGMKQTGNVNYALISYSCMYGKTGSGEDTIFNDQQVVLYLPLALFFLCAVFWGIFTVVKRDRKFLTCHLVMTISVVHTTFLMHIFNTNLNMISCAKMEHGTYWLLYDLRVQCWVGRHMNYVIWYTIPSMFIWCIVLPVGMVVLLVKYKSKLKTPDNKVRFSFLCKGYKNQLFFWQFLIIFKKYFILIESVLFSQENPALPAIAVLLCLLIYIILQIYFKPYLKGSLNATEMLAVGSSITMLLAGLIGSGIDSEMSPVVTVFVVITFLILASFFMYLVVQVIYAIIKESKWMKKYEDKKRRKIIPQYDSVDAQLYESRNPIFNNSGMIDDVGPKKESEPQN